MGGVREPHNRYAANPTYDCIFEYEGIWQGSPTSIFQADPNVEVMIQQLLYNVL